MASLAISTRRPWVRQAFSGPVVTILRRVFVGCYCHIRPLVPLWNEVTTRRYLDTDCSPEMGTELAKAFRERDVIAYETVTDAHGGLRCLPQ